MKPAALTYPPSGPPPAGGRPGLDNFVRGAALSLGLLMVPAGPARAEEALFAPRTLAEAPALAPEPEAAGRLAAFSGLFSPEIRAAERVRQNLAGPGPDGRRERENPAPRRTPDLDGNPEKPYWEIEARQVEPPYFQAGEKPRESPYWQARENGEPGASPYWLAREAARERPYWEPPPERVEIIVPANGPAAAAPPPATEPAGNPLISYFMYQDEAGVKHLTNAPVDPRYREFTVTIRVRRGLAGAGALRFTPENLRPIILRAARTYGLDPALIAAVIKSESAFDAYAVSWAGAQGLMQLMPGTARDMECADPFDPAENIMAGSRYLRLMLDTFDGDLTLAVAAYNCGPELVSRRWRVPDIPETRNFVIIVSRNYERYKGRL